MKKLLWYAIVFLCFFIIGNYSYADTLTWDANSELDLAGYKVYRTTISGEYAEPEIVLGKITTYTILDEPITCVYWVVTAFDFEGLESDNSNEVSNCDGMKPYAPGTLIYINNSIVTINVGDMGTPRISPMTE